MSYSYSKKWVSASQKEQQRWRNIEAELRRNFPRSPFPPRTYTQWVDFQLEERRRALESRLHEAGDNLNASDEDLCDSTKDAPDNKLSRAGHFVSKSRQASSSSSCISQASDWPPAIAPPIHGRSFTDGRSAVLGMPSIWRNGTADAIPGRMTAPWPNAAEYKWEGDDRARSGVGRYLPLPRAGGNDTVAWHQRPMLEPLPFDAVRKVPTKEDVYSPVDANPDADISSVLNEGNSNR